MKKKTAKQAQQGRQSARSLAAPNGSDRTKYLGGSDAAAVLGVSPWRSAYKLWAEKQGGEPPEDLSLKPWIEWGNRLEPFVADAFADKTRMKVAVEPRFLTHSQYPFLGGHIDRRIVGHNAFLECKTANAFDYSMWGDPEQGVAGVPAHYVAQCDHYLLIGDFEYCYLAVLIGGSDFRTYRVERDTKREQVLLARELKFWDMVQKDIMPPIQSEEDARHRWRLSLEGTSIPVDAATRAKVVTLSQVSARRAVAEKEEKALRNDLIPMFRDAEALSFNGERIATMTAYTRKSFDMEAFKKKHKKIAEKFETSIPTKRLKLLV